MNEADIQREAVYLHEAGHAVMALASGFTVKTVTCDGVDGAVDKEPDRAFEQIIQGAQADIKAGKIDAAQYRELCFGACWPQFLVMLGGIAGESLESGRAISGMRRSADDLVTFFEMAHWIVKTGSGQDRDALLLRKFCEALDEAQSVIQDRKLAVRAIAQELKTQGTLTGQQVIDLISSERSKAAPSSP